MKCKTSLRTDVEPYKMIIRILICISIISFITRIYLSRYGFYLSVSDIICFSISLLSIAYVLFNTFRKKRGIFILSLFLFIIYAGTFLLFVRKELYIRNEAPLENLILLGRYDVMQRAIDEGYDIISDKYSLAGGNVLTTLFYFYHYTTIRKYIIEYDLKDLENRIYEMLKLLLEDGCDPNMMDEYSRAPIHYAMNLITDDNQIKIVRLLLEHGADTDVKDKYGDTPLHMAARGYVNIVQELLKHGADVNVKNNEGKTPLDIAIENDWEEIINILRKHGAKTTEELQQETSMN